MDKVTLDQFLGKMVNELTRFGFEWRKEAKVTPKDFPVTMTEEEWKEQFLSWLQIEAELKNNQSL